MAHPPIYCWATVSLGFRGGQPARRPNRPARTPGLPLTPSRAPVRNDFSSIVIALYLFVEHDLFGKPVTTHRVVARGHAFPDHALAPAHRPASVGLRNRLRSAPLLPDHEQR